MAGTLSTTLSISYSSTDTYADSVARSTSISHTISGTPRQSGRQSIGTSEETLQLGDVTSVGYVYVRNLDSTNYVQVGTATGQYSIKLPAGKESWFYANGNTIYAKANTAACEVIYEVFSA